MTTIHPFLSSALFASSEKKVSFDSSNAQQRQGLQEIINLSHPPDRSQKIQNSRVSVIRSKSSMSPTVKKIMYISACILGGLFLAGVYMYIQQKPTCIDGYIDTGSTCEMDLTWKQPPMKQPPPPANPGGQCLPMPDNVGDTGSTCELIDSTSTQIKQLPTPQCYKPQNILLSNKEFKDNLKKEIDYYKNLRNQSKNIK